LHFSTCNDVANFFQRHQYILSTWTCNFWGPCLFWTSAEEMGHTVRATISIAGTGLRQDSLIRTLWQEDYACVCVCVWVIFFLFNIYFHISVSYLFVLWLCK
jgi:hypothetical protein